MFGLNLHCIARYSLGKREVLRNNDVILVGMIRVMVTVKMGRIVSRIR